MKSIIQTWKGGLLILVLISLFTFTTRGQWEQIPGIEGGVIISMAANDSLVFAGTNVGVYRYDLSVNNPSWEFFIAPPIPEVTALALFNDSLMIGTPEGLFISPLADPVLIDYQKDLPGNNIAGIYVFPGEIEPDLAVHEKEFGLYLWLPDQKQWFGWNNGLPSNGLNSLIVDDSTNWCGCGFWIRVNDTIYISGLAGGIWYKWETEPFDTPIESMVVSENLFFAGTEEGIYHRDWLSWENTWDSIASLPGIQITALYKGSYSGDSVGLVAATPYHTIYFSKDHGTTWNLAQLPHQQIYDITGFCAMKDHTLALTDGGGVLISHDLEHWEAIVTGMNLSDIRSVTSYGGAIIAGTCGAGVFRSKAGGGFEKINDGLASADISIVFDAGLYLVACAGGAMYYLDQVDKWHDFSYNMNDRNPCVGISYLSTDISMTMAKSTGIWSIYFIIDTVWHPMNQGVEGIGISELTNGNGLLYATTFDHGVFQYNPGDTLPWESFTDIGLSLYLNTIRIVGSNIIVGSYDGIFELEPPYETWTRQNTGLTMYKNIALENHNDLLFGSFYPNNCFVAKTSTMEWHDRSDGLPEFTFIWDMCIDGSYIYAGSNRSLWKRTLGEMQPSILEPQSTNRVNCYPNPCHDHLYIESGTISEKPKNIQLIDIHGHKIIDQRLVYDKSGRLSLTVSGIQPGLYLVKLSTSSRVETCKIIIE